MHIGSTTFRSLGCALFVAWVTAVGCRPADKIESYVVPKQAPATAVRAVAAAPATPADRMLAAVLPEGDRAWFFKVTGPIAEVDAQAIKIAEFLSSIRPAPGKPHPDWKLPDGWLEQPASQMRVATLLIPAGTKPLELSVTVLPWGGGAEAMLGNVNRWRGQMQLAPIDAAGVAESTRELKVGDATMTIVDLRGNMSGGMMPPFAGGAMPQTPPTAASPAAAPSAAAAESDLPPGHPAVTTQSSALPSSSVAAPFQFETPAGWQQRPASGIRKAEFMIEAGDKSAQATAIDFPAASPPMMSDPVANVRRWRGEVGLPALSDEEIKKSMLPLKIDGIEAMWVDVVPDKSQPGQSQAERGTLAAMLTRGDAIWFFKLSGDRDVVAAQREKFLSFLKSLKFNGAGGEIDGNK